MTDFTLYDTLLAGETKKCDISFCNHSEQIREGDLTICLLCGEELERDITHDKEWRYYGAHDNKNSDPNRAHARKNTERTITKDVTGLNLSDNIINIANELYNNCTKGQIYRGGSRRSIIFACVFHAYKVTGDIKTPEKLIQLFGLTRKEGLKGLKIVNIKSDKHYKTYDNLITSKHIISDILDKFHTTAEQKQQIYEIYEQTQNKSSKLNRARPQSVASAVIYYWIVKNNFNMTLKDFAQKTNLSELTIVKNLKEVKTILS